MLIPLSSLKQKYGIVPKGIIHIGASYGQEADEYCANGVSHVVWIEAIDSVYEQLKKRIAGYPNNIAIKACVSDIDNQEVMFNLSSNNGESSSLLPLGKHTDYYPEIGYTEQIKMLTKTIKTILSEHKLDISNYNFLNIDLQGTELLALKGIGEFLNQINFCYIELYQKELYKGCSLYPEIDAYLKTFGFERIETHWTSEYWGEGFYYKQKL